MKGHIYIKGQIGDSVDAEGKEVKGINLEDIVAQVEEQKDAESFDVHIDSPGGNVKVGRAIAAYLKKMEASFRTIAENVCGSIATEIHLAAPVENRQMIAGTKYFIHNPLVENVSGDAAKLEEAADYVKVYEKEMLAMYVKATTTEKPALEALMALETYLNDEQVKTLGFVSEVTPEVPQLSAMALMGRTVAKKKNNILSFDMKDLNAKIIAIVKAAMPKKEVKGELHSTISTDKGELEYLSEGALPTVGEAVTMDGEPAAEGDYTTDDGTIIKIDAEGNVSEIVVPEEIEDDIDSLKAEVVKLKAANKEIKEGVADVVATEINKLKKQYSSEYVPVASTPEFKRDKAKKVVSDIRQDAIDRKAEYNAK